MNLSRALVLEAPLRVPDGAGGFAESWQALGTLWAEVVPGAGRDVAGEANLLGAVGYRITVRGAVPGSDRRPVPGQRFREGNRVFAVLAVAERDPGGMYLTCFAREEVSA
jgi:head-tail adaptor